MVSHAGQIAALAGAGRTSREHRSTDEFERDNAHHEPALALAQGLGWFSIGLGVVEVAAPDGLARLIGMPPRTRLLQLYGLREIAAGIGILSQQTPTPWLIARIAGDVLDLATLAAQAPSSRANGKRLSGAAAAVAGVTVLDILCSQMLINRRR